MPRPTIAEIRNGIVDFQKSYYWNLSFIRKPSILSITDAAFNLRVLSTDVPKRTGETATIMMRGFQIPDPGIYNAAGTITLTCVETVDATIRNLINEWETACTNKTAPFKDLTADIRLTMSNNQEQDNYSYSLLWAYLEDSEIPTLDGGTSDPMQPTLTLRYTDFKRQRV